MKSSAYRCDGCNDSMETPCIIFTTVRPTVCPLDGTKINWTLLVEGV